MNTQDLIAKVKQYPVFVGGAVLCLILIGVYTMRSGQVSGIESEEQDLSNQLKRYQINFSNSTNLEEHLEEIKALSENLKERTMDSLQRGQNLDYFYQFERESDLRVVSVVQEELADVTGGTEGLPKLDRFNSIGFIVAVEGKYPDLMAFLYKLQHDRYFIRVDSFSAQQALDAAQNSIRMELRLQILGKRETS